MHASSSSTPAAGPDHGRRPEILAPAGSPAVLTAALEAGADAVYLGLKQLNARRGAENFLPENLAGHVEAAHRRGARVHLTLNIDLTQREIGLAVRTLELARRARVDAVLVRDPALLAFAPLFPELEFHFSTQAGISSSAGVAAARALGLRRVVLARELSGAEIRAAAAVPGMDTEVFVQGALCFCASGRCLLSSWGGGRSGNRGTCTSPCRVPWSQDGSAPGKPFSMHDLGMLERLPELLAAGVASFKIEGRLKSADWVARAVRLYRGAMERIAAAPAGNLPPGVLLSRDETAQAAALGVYTGRQVTSRYFDGQRTGLTGDSGRIAAAGDDASGTMADEAAAVSGTAAPGENATASRSITVTVAPDPQGGLLWTFRAAGRTRELRTPPQPVRHAARGVALGELGSRLGVGLPKPWTFAEFNSSADADMQLPRSTANQIEKELFTLLRAADKEPDGTVRIDLPSAVKNLLQEYTAPGAAPHASQTRILGDRPDRVRLDPNPGRVAEFVHAFPGLVILAECADAAAVDRILEALPASGAKAPQAAFVPTLPAVAYEAQLPGLRAMLRRCQALGLAVEVNSWDGWFLAKEAGVRMEAGPGLMVLNGAAARRLHRLGCDAVMLSVEADRGQLEDACAAAADIPLSLTVFGRPPLLQTRVEFQREITAGHGRLFRDARDLSLRPRVEGAVTVFRPVQAFDWTDLGNARLRVAHLVADLCASPDPLREFRELGRSTGQPRFHFNYDRALR